MLELESTDNDVLSSALAWIRSQCDTTSRDEISDGVALAMMARRTLEDAASLEKPPSGEPYRVVIRWCPGCDTASTVDGGPVSDTVVSEAECDCEVIDLRPGPQVGQLTRAVPRALRRRVLDRDNWRCAVPRCGNRLWVDVHHLKHRAHGGRHEFDNLVVLCTCHHRLLHAGWLAVDRGKDGRVEVRGPTPSRRTQDASSSM